MKFEIVPMDRRTLYVGRAIADRGLQRARHAIASTKAILEVQPQGCRDAWVIEARSDSGRHLGWIYDGAFSRE